MTMRLPSRFALGGRNARDGAGEHARYDGYDNPDDQPTHQMSAERGTLYCGERLPLRHRLADPVGELERLPAGVARWGAVALLLATAEMNVISQVDGRPWWVQTLSILFRAPLHAAVAAALLLLLGRLTHRMARMFGGSGDSETTTDVVMLFAAAMAVPAGIAVLLIGDRTDAVTVLELILSIAALVLGARLVARLEGIEVSKAATALILPGVVVMVVIVLLAVVQSFLLSLW